MLDPRFYVILLIFEDLRFVFNTSIIYSRFLRFI